MRGELTIHGQHQCWQEADAFARHENGNTRRTSANGMSKEAPSGPDPSRGLIHMGRTISSLIVGGVGRKTEKLLRFLLVKTDLVVLHA